MDPGFPKHPSRPESLDLGHDDGNIGQLDFSLSLGGLARHEVADALKDRFFHGQDLAVDVSPVQRLFERGGSRVTLLVHAQRVVPASGRRHNVGPVLMRVSRVHRPVIHGPA